MSLPDYQEVEDAFREGAIEGKDGRVLAAYLLRLANQPIDNDRIRHRDIIRGLTLNHILLQRHMDKLDRANRWTQALVILLTALTLGVGAIQIWFAYKADIRGSEPAQSAPAPPAAQAPPTPTSSNSSRR